MVLRVAVLLAMLVSSSSLSARAFDYAEGQIWAYHTRRQDPGSLLKIQKIDVDPSRTEHRVIYHLSIIGVTLGDPNVPREISHVPVSRETLDDSVISLTRTVRPFPDAGKGIAEWRAAKGGVFTIPIAKIIDTVESAVKKMPKQPEPFYP